MQGNFKVITLCGSTRFKNEYIEVLASLGILEILKFGRIWMKEPLPKLRKCLMICTNVRLIWRMKYS